MNASKSEVYFNSMDRRLKDDILQVAGFKEGCLPFRYLGVPIQAGRIKKEDCGALVEKIVSRIRGIDIRKLSYAGRLVLVNSVLMSLHTYWATIFILPKSVIRRIECICRNFLWDGGSDYQRSPLVSWSKVCLPTKECGLGVRNAEIWNKAAIAKLASWIYVQADRLWVQWVHHLYIKGTEWQDYRVAEGDSWGWKCFCRVKEVYADAFLNGVWKQRAADYTIVKGYEWLRVKGTKVSWSWHVWNSWVVPKHSFVAWIIRHESLNTREKLYRFGISSTNLCWLCEDKTETHTQLLIYFRNVLIQSRYALCCASG
ncbi:hypothetical protein RND81_14G152500 [Saponaria officinalis]|uniref:Reverse transcriptase zinc-binding domain-containing protein n=1 Tax=Saponaria officinalis TaxID=3572 RepID=A0AAW1GU92_SAPOF